MPNFDGRLIEQSERLYTVRPRSVAIPINARPGDPLVSTFGVTAGERGTRAKIRLLSTDTVEIQRKRLESSEGFSSPHSKQYLLNNLLNRDPGAGYSDFLLTSVSVAMNEKVQITQTFGDAETVYYFGKAPIIFNLGGMLIDDLDNQWFTTFVEAYTHIMRGTELARNFELVEIDLPNMLIIGTVMGFSYQQEATRDTDIPFTMQVHAKEVRPIPVQIPAYAFTPEAATINFKTAQKLSNFLSTADINKILSGSAPSLGKLPKVTLPRVGGVAGIGGAVSNASTTLSGFRSSLFSPVFGVLTSITKVVKTVTGDISKIISSFTNPVNNVLRDIQGIAGQAIAVAHLIENSVNNVVNIPIRTLNEVRNTIISLRNAAGVISRVPESVAESIKRLTKFGSLSTSAAFLTKNGARLGSKTSLLGSGAPYTPAAGASLGRR